jgi:hypothetical protein
MYRLSIFLLSTIGFFGQGYKGCNPKNPGIEPLTGIRVVYNVPEVNWDSTVKRVENSYEVYYQGNLMMYRFEFIRSFFDENWNFFSPSLLHEYFVCHKDSIYGQMFCPDSSSQDRNKRQKVDTTIAQRAFENTHVDSFALKKPDSSYTDSQGNFIKIYNERVPGNTELFTLRFYYSKRLFGIPQTLARKMDNIQGMKLWRISIVAGSGYYSQYKMTFPERELYYEMKAVPIKEIGIVRDYFLKYKKANVNANGP